MNARSVVIVDGYSTTGFLIAELAEAGLRFIHVRSAAPRPAFLERSFDPAAYVRDLGHKQSLDDIVDQLVDEEVLAVVPGLERGVVLAHALSVRLGLPCNDASKSAAWRDKGAMAAALGEAGLAAPSTQVVRSASEVVGWLAGRECEAAVVVKPVNSAGTDGVRVCDDERQVQAAVEQVIGAYNIYGEKNRAALVQDYLVGHEYIVNCVSVGGVHKVSDIWTSDKTLTADGVPFYNFQDAVIPREAPEGLTEYARAVLDAVGIRNGAAHLEIMITAGGPVLIEVGARLMGSSRPDLVFQNSGTSHPRLLALAIASPEGFDRFDERETTHRQLMRYVWLRSDGTRVMDWSHWEPSLKALTTFAGLTTFNDDRVSAVATVDTLTSPGLVTLSGNSRDELERDLAWLRAWETVSLNS